MLTCFKNDTPIEMAKAGQDDELNDFMRKLYKDEAVVQERIQEVKEATGGSNGEKLSFGNGLCGA
jgi:hypothetical protein